MPLIMQPLLKDANWKTVLFIPVRVAGIKWRLFASVSYIVQSVVYIFRAYKVAENIPLGVFFFA